MNVPHATAVSSATVGLYLALRAIGATRRTEIITTPFTFVATVEAIVHTGATPVLADINPHTLTIDPDEVTRKITSRTVAILPVDIAGYPCEYKQLRKIARAHSLFLLADAAHTFAAQYRGKTIPHLADAAVFSFYSTKNLTCGEGGMVVSKRGEFIKKVKQLSQHGITRGTYERTKRKSWKYNVTDLGFKANMSDVQAAIGLGQLTTFDREQKQRKQLAERYRANLKDLWEYLELPSEDADHRHGWHLFIIKLNLPRLRLSRNRFIEEMAAAGIECGVHYQPVYTLDYYRKTLNLPPSYFPNSTYAGKRVVSLPLYPTLRLRDVDYICERIETITKRFAR